MALNFAQFINNSSLSNAIKQRVLDGVIQANGYTDTILDGNGNPIPNPITKVQFFNFSLTKYIKGCMGKVEATPAGEAAANAKIQEIEGLGIE